LKTEGFGILTEIDVSAILNKKTNDDYPAYKILGACNPASAHKAVQLENKIGTVPPATLLSAMRAIVKQRSRQLILLPQCRQ
jgi:uncharacterized protein (DUF302 family)